MCGSPMRKNGTTSAGKQRWRCDSCHTSSVRRREDSTRIAQFHAFLRWVTGTASMQAAAASIGVSTPTFLRAIDWCWKVRPRLGDGGVAHRFVEVDGTYVPYGWCMLVAVGEDGSPIGWQWCHKENTAAYRALMRSNGATGPVGVRRRPLLPESRGPGVAGHAGATLPGAHATQHVHQPDAQPQERGRPRTARPHQETAPHPRGRAGRRMDGGARRLAHAPRRLHQGTHVRQGRSRQPQGQGGTHMVVDP